MKYKSWYYFLIACLGLVGCSGTPCVDNNIKQATILLNDGATGFAKEMQPILRSKIDSLKLEKVNPGADIVAIDKQIAKYEELYKQSQWLPQSTKELRAWALDEPLEE